MGERVYRKPGPRRTPVRRWRLTALVLTGACAASPSPERHTFTDTAMGAPCRIVVSAVDRAAADAAARSAFGRIHRLDRTLSDYDNTSELMRLCRQGGRGPVAVSADLLRILQVSADMHERTAGAFDPTLGPLVRLWRRARRLGELPEPSRLAEAMGRTGMEHVALDPAAGTVALARPGMQLDLGGIAKGFAADEALAVLRAAGFPAALVDVGGDIAVGAPPPGEAGWTVLAAPLGASAPDPLELTLHGLGIATSGDASRHIEIDGVRYSHIVDPWSGMGLVGGASATVWAADATTADALASAAAVLGEPGLDALLAQFPTAGIALRLGRGGRAITAGRAPPR